MPDTEKISTSDKPGEAEVADNNASPTEAELEEELEGDFKPGLLYRLNPVNLFRKESPATYVKQGLKFVDHQNLALATLAFQKALELDGDNVKAFKGLGTVFLKKGGKRNIESALKHYNEAIKRNPFDDRTYAFTAKIYDKLGRLKEATMERKKMMIIKTLESDPKNSVANNNMGILLLQFGEVDKALNHFKSSIKANNQYDVAYRNLAATHYKLADDQEDAEKQKVDLDKAMAYINKALSIDPNVHSLVIQGKIFLLEGRPEEALKVCENAENLDRAHKSIFMLKRIVLEKLNRTKEAQEAFEAYQILQGPG